MTTRARAWRCGTPSRWGCAAGIVLLVWAAGAQAGAQPPPPGHLIGQITEAGTGQPVAGALVVVTEAWHLYGETWTAQDGSYRFKVDPPGVYDVVVSLRGYMSVYQWGVRVPPGKLVRVDGQLGPLQNVADLGRIVGFVRDEQGIGFVDTDLLLTQPGPDGMAHPVGASRTQNATGIYELEWYPPGSYGVVVALRPEPVWRDDVRIRPGASVRLNFTIHMQN